MEAVESEDVHLHNIQLRRKTRNGKSASPGSLILFQHPNANSFIITCRGKNMAMNGVALDGIYDA